MRKNLLLAACSLIALLEDCSVLACYSRDTFCGWSNAKYFYDASQLNELRYGIESAEHCRQICELRGNFYCQYFTWQSMDDEKPLDRNTCHLLQGKWYLDNNCTGCLSGNFKC